MGAAPGTFSREGEFKVIRTVDRYVGMAAILGVLLVWFSLTALMMMFNLLGELRDTTANYGATDVFWFVLLTAPPLGLSDFPCISIDGLVVGYW